MSALGRRRAAIHQWIRDDLPLSAKMILTPRHMDALEARLDAVAGCVNHPERWARENLDGENLCQECCDDWVRGEGVAALEQG